MSLGAIQSLVSWPETMLRSRCLSNWLQQPDGCLTVGCNSLMVGCNSLMVGCSVICFGLLCFPCNPLHCKNKHVELSCQAHNLWGGALTCFRHHGLCNYMQPGGYFFARSGSIASCKRGFIRFASSASRFRQRSIVSVQSFSSAFDT